jgi:hypothetical protein
MKVFSHGQAIPAGFRRADAVVHVIAKFSVVARRLIRRWYFLALQTS